MDILFLTRKLVLYLNSIDFFFFFFNNKGLLFYNYQGHDRRLGLSIIALTQVYVYILSIH